MQLAMAVITVALLACVHFIYIRFGRRSAAEQRSTATSAEAAARSYPVSGPTRAFKYAKWLVLPASALHVVLEITRSGERAISLWTWAVGTLTSVVGVVFLWASFKALSGCYSGCEKGVLPSRLVKTGPYRVVNHPIYYSNLVVLTGIAVSYPGPLIVGVLVMLAFFYAFSIRDENRALRAAFPGERE